MRCNSILKKKTVYGAEEKPCDMPPLNSWAWSFFFGNWADLIATLYLKEVLSFGFLRLGHWFIFLYYVQSTLIVNDCIFHFTTFVSLNVVFLNLSIFSGFFCLLSFPVGFQISKTNTADI